MRPGSQREEEVVRDSLSLHRNPLEPKPRRALPFSPEHLAASPGVAQMAAPPTPSLAIGTLRGGVAPLGMNGRSDGFQNLQPSHKGQWEGENPSSCLFSPIMANNLVIQWRVSR